tara:strand:- start:111 stop:485 length:375 start_codon:yes stop_codon:yes gene_type:complete
MIDSIGWNFITQEKRVNMVNKEEYAGEATKDFERMAEEYDVEFPIPPRIKQRKMKALKESLVTVGTGLIINWPISVVLLYLFIDILQLSTLMVSIYVTLCFTLIAVIRVYLIRMFFTKRELDDY